jgi:hypothetical protein
MSLLRLLSKTVFLRGLMPSFSITRTTGYAEAFLWFSFYPSEKLYETPCAELGYDSLHQKSASNQN